MKIRHTERGFARADFTDRYGEQCSIQKSSLAFEDCLWLGVNDPKPKYLVYGEGWKDYPLPEGVEIIGSRMHLTREMAAELIPLLQHFVDTGELPEEARQEAAAAEAKVSG